MVGINHEPPRGASTSDELIEELERRFDHRSTTLTNKMAVRLLPKVERRRALAGVTVFDHPNLLEFFKDAIDGGGGHVRTRTLDVDRELLGRLVPGVRGEGLE